MKAIRFLLDVRDLLKNSSRFPTIKLFLQAFLVFLAVLYSFIFLDKNTVMIFAFILIPNLITRSFLKLYRVDDKMVEEMPPEERLMTTDNFFLVIQVCFILAMPSLILCFINNFNSTLIALITYVFLGYRLLSIAKNVFKSDTPYWRDAFIFTRILVSLLGGFSYIIYITLITETGKTILEFIKLPSLINFIEKHVLINYLIYLLIVISIYFILPKLVYFILKKAKVYDRLKHLEALEAEKKTEEEQKQYNLNQIAKGKLYLEIKKIYIDKIVKKSEFYIDKFHSKYPNSSSLTNFVIFVKKEFPFDYELLYSDKAKRIYFEV